MELTSTYSNTLLEMISVLNTFSVSKFVWKKYEKFAIPKIEDSTIKIRGTFYDLNNLKPKQAEQELQTLNQFKPLLYQLKQQLELIEDMEFLKFKNTALDFFTTLKEITDTLNEITDIHSSYKRAMPVLAKDWDRPEDNHWDNY
ncbi:MAG: hypothetical protein CVT88_01140 [Candidatus Altiarchaeales archaeon HGW-Altiarchaeales-1]|nr:MAG: hypothetical protein CVT88_01140 [Candidatus Altiarchaeales archaeon HGW-Altiarchaeales-1]